MTMTQPGADTDTTDAYQQHITDRLMRRGTLQAELTAVLAEACDKLRDARDIVENLALDLDPAMWLDPQDRVTLNRHLAEALNAVHTAAAIHRPYPGTGLWPQAMPWDTGERLQWGVSYLMADGSGGIVCGRGMGFTRDSAELKAEQLLRDGHVASARVVRRWHSATAWAEPEGAEQ